MLKKITSFVIFFNFILPFNNAHDAHKRDSDYKEESGHSTTTLVACSAGAIILGIIITKAIISNSKNNNPDEIQNKNAKIEKLKKELQGENSKLIKALEENVSLAKKNQEQSKENLEQKQNLMKLWQQKRKLKMDLILLKRWLIPEEIQKKAEDDSDLQEDLRAVHEKFNADIQHIIAEYCS